MNDGTARSAWRWALVALAAAFAGAAPAGAALAHDAREAQCPAPGEALEASLGPGEVRACLVQLAAGQVLRLALEQRLLEADIRVLGPDGARAGEVRNTAGVEEPLTLTVRAALSGPHRIVLSLLRRVAPPGRYRLTVEAPRSATEDDERRMAAERLRSEADDLVGKDLAAESARALEGYRAAAEAFQALGDTREEASTLSRIADVEDVLGDRARAIEAAERTLELSRAAGDRRGEAGGLNRLGLYLSVKGEPRRGLELIGQSVAMWRSLGDRIGLSEALNNEGVTHSELGELHEAVEWYGQALAVASAAGKPYLEAMALKNRANDYRTLGDADRALADERIAQRKFHRLEDRREEGWAEVAIANTLVELGRPAPSLAHYGRALRAARLVGDRRLEALVRVRAGLARLRTHQPARALEDLQAGQALATATEQPRVADLAQAAAGRATVALGRHEEGLALLREAVPRVRRTGNRWDLAAALGSLVAAERAAGELEAARADGREAVELVESLRRGIAGPKDRALYLARARERYDDLIAVLLALDAQQPGSGLAAEALRVNELARARTLVELVSEGPQDLREGADDALLARERELDGRLDALRREAAHRGSAPGAEPDSAAEGALLAELDDVESAIRAASPRFAALARPEPLTLARLQEEVLDPDTVLLEYALGEEGSVVWAVTRTLLTWRALPPRAGIEADVRRLVRAWAMPSGQGEPGAEALARRVSRTLLGPVAAQLGARRIVVVADGALLLLPFAALPGPGAAGEPLVARHEVVSAPSATTIAVVRAEAARRPAAGRTVAILADPVFQPDDPRVPGGAPPPAADGAAAATPLTLSLRDAGRGGLERLEATRREATAIAALAGPAAAFEALDFAASRETALGPAVAEADIVHLASHGLLDERHPELSGIVLSLVDEHGRPRDGFLQARDVYRMRLSARLVVLSACQTALGKEVRGEGLLGLARGFMYAGAPRVVASQWRVADRSTAELMTRFYAGVLRDGLAPAAALRAAQLSMWRDPRWSDPHGWAAFTLQGEWR